MNYKYEIINYDQNTPAKVMYLNLSSETHKTELHWHREPELVYVIEGQAECPRNGETTLVNEGILFFSTVKMFTLFGLLSGQASALCAFSFRLNICECSASQLTALFLTFLFHLKRNRSLLKFFRKLPKQIPMTSTAHFFKLLMSIRFTICS